MPACSSHCSRALGRGGRLQHPISVTLQRGAGQQPQRGFVFHEQDDFPTSRSRRSFFDTLGFLRESLEGRQENLEDRPLANRARDLPPASVLAHDPEDRRQSEPGAESLRLGREKWLENVMEMLGRDAAPRIATQRRTNRPGSALGWPLTYSLPISTTSILTERLPPSGMASRALTIRFIITCSIMHGSA